MHNHEQPNPSPQRRLIFNYFVQVLSTIAVALAIITLIINWGTLSECFKRQSLVVLGVLIFSRIKLGTNIRSMFEVFPLLLVFALIEKINISVADETCLVPDTIYKKTVYILYYCMFGFYLGMTIAFTLLLIFVIIYRFYDHFYLHPRRIQALGINGKEFDELDTIKFSPQNESPTTRALSCSICLAEYQEGDLVMRLPLCNHHFHKECIKVWLKDHLDCPYCRADIRTNLKVMKSMRENNGRFIMQSPIQLEPPSRGRQLIDDESRDSYVEMR